LISKSPVHPVISPTGTQRYHYPPRETNTIQPQLSAVLTAVGHLSALITLSHSGLLEECHRPSQPSIKPISQHTDVDRANWLSRLKLPKAQRRRVRPLELPISPGFALFGYQPLTRDVDDRVLYVMIYTNMPCKLRGFGSSRSNQEVFCLTKQVVIAPLLHFTAVQ
jgi:hypothetical protein